MITTKVIAFKALRNLLFYLFQSSAAFHIEPSHLICSANQMTGFYMKCNTGLKWVKRRLVTPKLVNSALVSQLTFTCSKSTIETLEKSVKHIQS